MNNPGSPVCPHCRSHQLIAHTSRRKVFIDHKGERIPLLTVNYTLGHPVIEANSTTYTCACSWAGVASELGQPR